ncbi:uncharacterized protein LOC142538422 [Primulina tabacum]|uniref:uncharacterized protein LOC142538422 n=1 Tax=Primulina tabacum TaxID=48773 RepID=UPI003F59AD96
MRKFTYSSYEFGLDFPPPPLLSPLPSPSAQPIFPDLIEREIFLFSSVPTAKTIFDFATLSFIACLLLFSLFAFSFVFHLRLRSRHLPHLRKFNSLWTVRLLLVLLAAFWALNEILRLPFVRRKYFYPFLPPISLQQQANICKLHVVLSLGLFEPGFLITLLFLVNVSIKKRNQSQIWALVSIFAACTPIALLQTFLVHFWPVETKLSKFLHGSSVLSNDNNGNRTVLCTYPFFSCVVFSAFAIGYVMVFLLSCWRVLSFVINKSIRRRINTLSTMIMVALPLQILCLSLSWLWMPEYVAYGCVVLAMFVGVTCCMVVAEVILVIKPITDALAAGGSFSRCDSSDVSCKTLEAGDTNQLR